MMKSSTGNHNSAETLFEFFVKSHSRLTSKDRIINYKLKDYPKRKPHYFDYFSVANSKMISLSRSSRSLHRLSKLLTLPRCVQATLRSKYERVCVALHSVVCLSRGNAVLMESTYIIYSQNPAEFELIFRGQSALMTNKQQHSWLM